MLVALVVLGLLVVALSRGVRTGLQIEAAQERSSAAIAERDASVRTLRSLLTNIAISPAAAMSFGTPVAIKFQGTAKSLSLVGFLPDGAPDAQLADMTLYLSG